MRDCGAWQGLGHTASTHGGLGGRTLLGVYVIGFLQCALQSYEFEAVLEVLHELLVVNPTVAVDVSVKGQGDDLGLCEVDISLLQALDVLQDIQESVLVQIVFLEELGKE